MPLATATERAKSVDVEVDVDERDPHAERELRNGDTMTVGELFKEWHTRHAVPNLSRAGTDDIIFRCHIEPEFAKRKVRELTRVEIGRFRDEVAKKATPLDLQFSDEPVEPLLQLGARRGAARVQSRRPSAQVGRPQAARAGADARHHHGLLERARPHGDDDRRAHGPRREGAHAVAGVALDPASAAADRDGGPRVVGALKSELELQGPEPVWTIPGERTKNSLLHRVPLCPMAKAEFVRAIAASPAKSPFVFASADNPGAHVTPLSITRGMARLVNELKIPTVSPHDLRRTVGTEMARLGIAVHIRSLVLNHSPQSRGITEAVYNRYAYDKEKREALALWEAELMRLIGSAASIPVAALSQ